MNVSRSAVGTAYDRTGSPDSPALVLIHGLGLNALMWDSFVPQLSEAFQVVRYDLYGHGQSSASSLRVTLPVLARQLKELLDELGISRCSVMGFSLGGMINRRFAMDYPNLTVSLVILNSPHERSYEQQQQVETRAADTQSGGALATIDAAIERWFTPQFRAVNITTVQRVRQWVLGNDPKSFAECRRVLATGVHELVRPKPPINVPALVMTCENDSGSTPAMSLAISEEIAASEAIIVPELRHLGLMENPDAFIEPALKFLAKHTHRVQVEDKRS